MVARAIWKGSISFGMVTIPVGVYTAIDEEDVALNMLHASDLGRVRQKRFCGEEDVEISNDEIVKGFEVSPGRYVVITEEEFKALPVSTSKTVEIEEFVEASQVDPLLHEKAYFLAPDGVASHKAFMLLLTAMLATGCVAVAQVTMFHKEKVCTLRPYGGTLVLETLFYGSELRPASQLELGEGIAPSPGELEMAAAMVTMMTSPAFDPSKYKDGYRQALLELIEAKTAGLPPAMETPAGAAQIIDLREALQASVAALEKARPRRRARRAKPAV